MSASLVDCLTTTDALATIFSDHSVLQAMLDVEAALARAAAGAGAIPAQAARSISAAATAAGFDAAALAREARETATPVIPLVKALTERVGSADADGAQHVHWGATSQDVSDTAMILLLRQAHPVLAADHARLGRALRDLSDRHGTTIMLGRTLMQPATPITFGLKAAGWCAAVNRSWRRLSMAWQHALVLQLGGAAGTRAAFGNRAASITDALARELGLAAVPPWHTDRDRLGALVTAAGLYGAALGKVARDVALLMQAEIGEVLEPGGGSSTLPHKRNPSGCALVIAAAMRLPGLAASFLIGMLQEHERSIGGSQAEWPTIASVVQASGSAVAALATVMEGLIVDPSRMRANLEATKGEVFAERAVLLLGSHFDRRKARSLVGNAISRSRQTGQTFAAALRAEPELSADALADVLADIDRPEQYLGEAEALRRQLLEE